MTTPRDDHDASLRSAAYWAALAPDLHVEDAAFQAAHAPSGPALGAGTARAHRALMRAEGYVEFRPPWTLSPAALAAGIERLSGRGWPPPLAFVYDEYWLAFARLRPLLECLLGPGPRVLPSFWAWRIDAAREDAGWGPHRDRGQGTLDEAGDPKSLTAWIALTDTDALNGCIYLVPADRDPTYGTPDEAVWRFGLQDIRALPAPAGTVFCWNQKVLHWGGRASARGRPARVSLSVEFQRADVAPFAEPLGDMDRLPSLAERIGLIARQMLQYDHMHALSAEHRSWAEKAAS